MPKPDERAGRPAAEGPQCASLPAPNGASGTRQCREGTDHLRRGLNQFDQNALARDRELVVALGMQKADVETGRTLAYAARRKSHTLGSEPLHRLRPVIEPQTDMVPRLALLPI